MRRERSLIRVVGWRVFAFALIAMALQAIFVLFHYYSDNRRLADLMLDLEVNALAAGIETGSTGIGYELPDGLASYHDRQSIARIRLPTGEVLFSNCDTNCTRHLLPLDLAPPDSWLRLLSDGKPIHVAGGRTVLAGNTKVFIEVALFSDSTRVMWGVLWDEMKDHMIFPMIIMLALTFGATVLSIHRALRPVADVARAAETVDPLNPAARLPEDNVPREIAEVVRAVNRTLARIGDVMRAQKLYTASISHEVRAPLAAMKLALNQIDDPRAKKIDEDIGNLSHLVGQLTELGRLETFDRSSFVTLDLAAIGRDVVADIAPLTYASGRQIGFTDDGPLPARGLPGLIENAIRNLVDNAIRHTPDGTVITVAAGPGAAIRVEDSAGIVSTAAQMDGAPGSFRRDDHIGIGLEIVRRISALHGGTFTLTTEPGRLTRAELVLPAQTAAQPLLS